MPIIISIIGCSSPFSLAAPPVISESKVHEDIPSRLENIDYEWTNYRVKITFYRGDPDSEWTMQVKDAWGIDDQLVKDERVWTASESRCSIEDALRIMNYSLSRFYSERPNAKVKKMDLEMEVIRDIWVELLAGFNEKLSVLESKKSASRADVPEAVINVLEQESKTSQGLKRITELLRGHGLSVRRIYPTWVTFKDSLTGKTWSFIGKSQGAGVLMPGIFEFDLTN